MKNTYRKSNLMKFGLLFALLFFYVPCYANDTTATVTPDAIEFTQNDNISMDEEILTISDSKIEVNYRFTNHSNEDLFLEVAFPLPLAPIDKELNSARVYPIWDESYLSYRFLDENPIKTENNEIVSNANLFHMMNNGKAPFLDFERRVDGSLQSIHYRILAKTKEGKDITKLLKNNNIPISATFLVGFMEEGKLAKDKALTEKLKKLALLDEKGFPIWRNQTIYYWKQLFPANKTITVTHSYTPHTGQFFMVMPKKGQSENDITFYHRDLLDKNLTDFYQTKELKNFLLQKTKKTLLLEESTYISVKEVDYILTTAKNWKGPIKKFTLNVIEPPNSHIVYNKEFQLKKTGNHYSFSKENFVPSADLKILFVSANEN